MAQAIAATGTITASTASLLTFASQIREQIILTNHNATADPVYVRFNDAASPLVSTTVFDVILQQGAVLVLERSFLSRFPVKTIGVYTVAATPKFKAAGWTV